MESSSFQERDLPVSDSSFERSCTAESVCDEPILLEGSVNPFTSFSLAAEDSMPHLVSAVSTSL